jgi:hypothetical protein
MHIGSGAARAEEPDRLMLEEGLGTCKPSAWRDGYE